MNTSIYLQLISLNKTYNNHFLKRYVKLVSFFKERNFKKNKFIHHEHHIIPKSFGGLDSKENLVNITIREHFILHYLLYKAFPKSKMVNAFFGMCSGWGHYSDNKVSSKVYANAMLEFGKSHSETQKKLVAEGKHHWLGGNISRENCRKMIEDGTHPWQGDGELQRKNNLKRVEEGRHNFSGPENNLKKLENGTHPSQIKKVCPYCNKEFSLNTFAQWHGDKCKVRIH